ncbi:hypothetical protein HDR58_07415 [bacterium]|nr:hypothetical protein [bacterium]
MDKKKFINLLCFIILAVVTVWLRYLYLNTDLWYDEACSWFTAKQSFPFGIEDNLSSLDLQHTPLYFYMLHFWMKMFGDSEIAMRILSLIFGLASVPMVYLTAKKIANKQVALFATALTAVSPLMTIFSVEIRMYPVVIFWVLLSLNYLIDFEQKKDNKSLVKLVIANLLIPYTLVGGILYNVSLAACYLIYLLLNKSSVIKKYLVALSVELLCLIPYFIKIAYYAKMRDLFVVSHEGHLKFFHVVDVIRNFFGVNIATNIYWPEEMPYDLTILFAISVIVPCVYFVYGLVQGCKNSDKFLRTLYCIFFISFGLSVLFSLLEVNVFTSRYILYLLPPFFILSVLGLSKMLTAKHWQSFLTVYLIIVTIFNVYFSKNFDNLKTRAFKSVKIEADKLELDANDIVIMPFGSDAPYYFRSLSSPRVFEFDFHKEIRNPNNEKYYDEKQQQNMFGSRAARVVYTAVMSDRVFSDAYFEYFLKNINYTVPSGRYVLMALYSSDASLLIDIQDLRKSIKDEHSVQKQISNVMFAKYLYDTRAMLMFDFDLLKTYTYNNYTFLLFRKR